MNPNWKLIVRTVLLVIVTVVTSWAALGYSFERSALAAVLVSAIQAVLELLGPTSDAGVKWKGGTQ